MVGNIRMEYNICINRCISLILLHKSVFYYRAKGRSDELLRMRMNEIASVWVLAHPYPFETGRFHGQPQTHVQGLLRRRFELKGTDVVQVMDTITFGNQMLPKRVKVDNGSKFITKILDK